MVVRGSKIEHKLQLYYSESIHIKKEWNICVHILYYLFKIHRYSKRDRVMKAHIHTHTSKGDVFDPVTICRLHLPYPRHVK